MTPNHISDVDALADYIFDAGYVTFREMNECILSLGVTIEGDCELTGADLKRPHIPRPTTLRGRTSADYVEIVTTLFNRWPVELMIGNPASFAPGDEPWWVSWTGRQNLLKDNIVMSRRPAVNPDAHDMADRAKHAFAVGAELLAETQYRIAELAGTGQLDRDESMNLQHNLVVIYEQLYSGTLSAVRDENSSDWTWDENDNTYSDGRKVITQVRVEPLEQSDDSWKHNRFMLGDGAPNEFPLGTVSYIAPVHPEDPPNRTAPPPSVELQERLKRHFKEE